MSLFLYFFRSLIKPEKLAAIAFLSLYAVSVSAQNFRVQLAAYPEPKPNTYFRERGLNNVISVNNGMGAYQYFLAEYFKTREAAEKILLQVKEKGFPFATILDIEEQRVLSGVGCPYYRNGVIIVKDTAQEVTSRNIYFDAGRYNLTPEAKTELNTVADWLKTHPKLKLGIVGYTDNTGASDVNMNLATERSRSARNYLIAKGIRADRMFIQVLGEAGAAAPNTDEMGNEIAENQRWNRRVMLAIADENGELKYNETIGRKNKQP